MAVRINGRRVGLVALVLLAGTACMADLGNAAGPGTRATASGINDAGVVVGTAGTHAVVSDPDPASLRQLSAPCFADTEAMAVNNSGVVVGRATARVYVPGAPLVMGTHAYLWNLATGASEDLDTWVTVPHMVSTATAVNDAGLVVGSVASDPRTSQAAVWDLRTRTFRVLGPANTYEFTADVNEAGQVVGVSNGRPMVWDATTGTRTELPIGGFSSASPAGINDTGDIVGTASVATDPGTTRMVRWSTVERTLTPIGPDTGWSRAEDVNDARIVVGSTGAPDTAQERAVRLDLATGQVTDLGDLGAPGARATAISADGQIAGMANVADPGTSHLFRWRP